MNTDYDYVIAGGGSAGCTLAARLAADPSLKLCLVEAGFAGPAGYRPRLFRKPIK